jgi:hypothetical protein
MWGLARRLVRPDAEEDGASPCTKEFKSDKQSCHVSIGMVKKVNVCQPVYVYGKRSRF